MKIGFLLFIFTSFASFAQTPNCDFIVEKTCLNSLSIEESKIVEDFLFDEKEIGIFFYMTHLNQIKIYKANNLYKLNRNYVDSKALSSFMKFAIKELGIYNVGDEIDMIQAFRDGEFFDSKEVFKAYLISLALDHKEVDAQRFGGCDIPFEPILDNVRSRPESFKRLLNFLTSGTSTSFSVYPLLDNGNENVQDAQYMIASGDFLILINQFWFL